ncbi:hypothetical protein FQZ97_716440 [compost metagenome]
MSLRATVCSWFIDKFSSFEIRSLSELNDRKPSSLPPSRLLKESCMLSSSTSINRRCSKCETHSPWL